MVIGKKGFVFGMSVISGIFVLLLIFLPIVFFGGGVLTGLFTSKYAIYLVVAVVVIMLLSGGKRGR